MKTLPLASVALLAIAGSAALSQPGAQPDGSMSVDALRQRSAERFERLDTDRDGQLSREELRSGRRGSMAGHRHEGPDGRRHGMHRGGPLLGADADNDGAVTQQEYTAQALQRFQRLDGNRDGRITAEEMQARRGRMAARGGRRFANLDADGNGAISRGEFDRNFAERIGRLDVDRDGRITAEERQASRARREAPQP